jgi:hypothetical protein
LFVVVGVCKIINDFHKNQLDSSAFEHEIYLYVTLSPLSIIGLPMVQSTFLYILVYLSPLALLLLIILLNRNYQIFTKPKIVFYFVEALLPAFAVAFVMVSDTIKCMVVLIAIGLSAIVMIIEMSVVYYSGVNLERNGKVHPE